MLKRFMMCGLLLTAAACSSEAEIPGQSPMASLNQITSEQWQALAQRTVYFGHQSVGADIMDGVREIAAEYPQITLRVVSGKPAAAAGVLNEFAIGKNNDLDSKNAAFLSATQGSLGAKPVLMFKYCFVDVDIGTDVKTVFDHYQQTIAALKAQHPDAVLVHVTMPLVSDSRVRNYINSVLGRPTRVMRNALRARYNAMLRSAYVKEPIFDLEAVESTRADGKREYAILDGQTVFSLAQEWTTDGGHLNAMGRRRAAEQLLVTLAALSDSGIRR